MRINYSGELSFGVTAKDLILATIGPTTIPALVRQLHREYATHLSELWGRVGEAPATQEESLNP